MQYVQQVRKAFNAKKAKIMHAAAISQSITQMRTAGMAVTTLQARMAPRR